VTFKIVGFVHPHFSQASNGPVGGFLGEGEQASSHFDSHSHLELPVSPLPLLMIWVWVHGP